MEKESFTNFKTIEAEERTASNQQTGKFSASTMEKSQCNTSDRNNCKDEKFKELNSEMTEEKMQNYIKLIMQELEMLPKENRKHTALMKVKKIFGTHLPESLLELTAAVLLDGDSGVSIDEKPSWLDMEKFRRGQKFYQDYSFALIYNEMLALFALLSFDLGLNPLIFTGASSTPYKAFKRYLSTHFRFDNWYTSDPWTRGTPAYNDMKYTRQIHNIVRRSLSNASVETYEKKIKLDPIWCLSAEKTRQDFKSVCPIAIPTQCPTAVFNNFSNQTVKHISQGAMSATQFGFCGLIVYKPHLFGIHNATDEDLEAFCHLWRGFGYLLGIDDDINFCRGSLEDVRARSKDILEYWVKPNFRDIKPECEHMLRCITKSTHYYYPLTNFECVLLHIAEIMEVPMPRFFASLPFHIKFLHLTSRFLFQYAIRIPGVLQFMNYTLNRAMLKAQKFDEETHKQLQLKSEKTLASNSSMNLKSIEKTTQMNLFVLLTLKLILIAVTGLCAIIFY